MIRIRENEEIKGIFMIISRKYRNRERLIIEKICKLERRVLREEENVKKDINLIIRIIIIIRWVDWILINWYIKFIRWK